MVPKETDSSYLFCMKKYIATQSRYVKVAPQRLLFEKKRMILWFCQVLF